MVKDKSSHHWKQLSALTVYLPTWCTSAVVDLLTRDQAEKSPTPVVHSKKKRRCTSGVSPDLVYQARKSADQCTAETVVRNLRRTRPNNKRAIENSAFNFVI